MEMLSILSSTEYMLSYLLMAYTDQPCGGVSL